jgi:hypothetical protein
MWRNVCPIQETSWNTKKYHPPEPMIIASFQAVFGCSSERGKRYTLLFICPALFTWPTRTVTTSTVGNPCHLFTLHHGLQRIRRISRQSYDIACVVTTSCTSTNYEQHDIPYRGLLLDLLTRNCTRYIYTYIYNVTFFYTQRQSRRHKLLIYSALRAK